MIDFAPAPTLTTPRLTLRPWRASDVAPFAEMSADPEVMRHFPAPLSAEQSAEYVAAIQARFRKWGFGYWAVETADAPFIGFVGLSRPGFEAHFTPAVEVGWRLARGHWGVGYATEAAAAALRFGFDVARTDEIVSMTSLSNASSIAVMERLGMTRDPADYFDHPGLASAPALARCVLYRLTEARWRARGREARLPN